MWKHIIRTSGESSPVSAQRQEAIPVTVGENGTGCVRSSMVDPTGVKCRKCQENIVAVCVTGLEEEDERRSLCGVV
ncbi:hypothetical protein N7524_011870 [Penicillium chrysogenum]|nr:hypothetical protein N7524_011870 [Penicillium chrysogenum]